MCLESIFGGGGGSQSTTSSTIAEPWQGVQSFLTDAYGQAQDIVTVSWGPLGPGTDLLEHPTLTGLAARHGKTAAQVVLRWHVQLGSLPIPKSATPERQRQNLDVDGFTLDDDEMAAITALGRPDGRLFGGDPDTHEEM